MACLSQSKTKQSVMSMTQQPSRSQTECLVSLISLLHLHGSHLLFYHCQGNAYTHSPQPFIYFTQVRRSDRGREEAIESAAWFTTVWEAVKRSIVFTWVCSCAWASASEWMTQHRKWKHHIQFKNHLELVCVCVCVPDNKFTPRCTAAAVGAPWAEPRPSCPALFVHSCNQCCH